MFRTFNIFNDHDKLTRTEEVNMLPDSFAALVIGKPGSGKSSLIQRLLSMREGFLKKFDLVLFMSPYEIGTLKIPENRKSDTLNIDFVYNTIEHEQQYRHVDNCLVIIDDLVSHVNKDANNPQLIDLIYNRRKIVKGCEISLLFTTQKYTLFPARFRSTLQFIIAFALPPDDWKILSQQQIFHPLPHLKSVLDAHFRSYKHNFIYLRLDHYGLFLNFEKQL